MFPLISISNRANIPFRKACIKVSFFFKKLPHVTYDHFFTHYGHVHSDLTVSARSFGLYKIQRYTQHHQTPEMKARLRALGMDCLDYDGCSTLWVRSWEDLTRFFGSDEYMRLSEDCKNFMETDAKGALKVFAG
jgi:hypothetical protein